MPSEAQITANQLNSELSTGPTSPEGKAVSALNALRHGIYAETPVLPGENPEEYRALVSAYQREFDPHSPAESALVEILVRSQWLTHRYDRIEAVVTWKYVADSGKSPDDAIADLYLQTKNNPLTRLQRCRETAQRHWFRALSEIRRLQKARGKAETADPAPIPDTVGFVSSKPPERNTPAWKHFGPPPDNSR